MSHVEAPGRPAVNLGDVVPDEVDPDYAIAGEVTRSLTTAAMV